MIFVFLGRKWISGFMGLLIWGGMALFLFPTPPSAAYHLFWADEFNTPLDTNVWAYRTGERLGSIQREQNVSVEKGLLRIAFRQESISGKETYTSGGIITRLPLGYGYYETKAKLWGGGSGLHSSFWNMGTGGDGITAPKNNQIIEIDGFEVDSHEPIKIEPNIHYYVGSHRSTGNQVDRLAPHSVDSSGEYFVMGFEWLPNAIRWYVNGKPIRETKDPLFYGPQQFWITALGTDAFGKIDPEKLPGVSEFEYVRYYVRDLPGGQWLANGDFEYNQAEGFEKSYIRALQFPVAWCEEGGAEASSVVVDPGAYRGGAFLRHRSPDGQSGSFVVSTIQRLPFLPPGRYRFGGHSRNPGQSQSALVIRQGGKEISRLPVAPSTVWTDLRGEFVTESFGIDFILDTRGPSPAPTDFDDLSLTQVGLVSEFEKTRGPEVVVLPGVVMVAEGNPGYRESGEWLKSSLAGWDGKSTRYLKQGPGLVVFDSPPLPAGKWKVDLFVPPSTGSCRQASVEMANGREAESQVIDQSTLSGWFPLGAFDLAEKVSVKVTLTPEPGAKGYLRANAVRFSPAWSQKCLGLKAIALSRARGFFAGQVSKIDPEMGGDGLWSNEGILYASALALKTLTGADGTANENSARFMAGDGFFEVQKGVVQGLHSKRGQIQLGQAPVFRQERLFIPALPTLSALGFFARFQNGILIISKDRTTAEDQDLLEALTPYLKNL